MQSRYAISVAFHIQYIFNSFETVSKIIKPNINSMGRRNDILYKIKFLSNSQIVQIQIMRKSSKDFKKSSEKRISTQKIQTANRPVKNPVTTNSKLPVIVKPKVPLNSKPKADITKKRINKGIPNSNTGWNSLPIDLLISISTYYSQTLFDVYNLSRTCRVWRHHICGQQGYAFWMNLPKGEGITDYNCFKLYLQKKIIQDRQKLSLQYQKMFTKLFNYGSTKQNVPNKLITKLNLQIRIKLNSLPKKTYPFKLRNFNFSSYLFCKVTDINQFKYNFKTAHNMFKDKLQFQIQFFSKRYKTQYIIQKKYVPEEIAEDAVKQKAFNYYLDKNIVLTFFQGDDNFLYMFFEISALELINIFRQKIKQKNKESLQKQMKKIPKYKQLAETQFQDFVQYVKFQADFEIHMSYHNSVRQIFTHCDTKVFPIQYDKKHAYFEVKIDDSFEKQATFKLDNKMGMSQDIQNLFLLDFVLKDRDRFLIIFSGFIYARPATQKQRQCVQNYLGFSDNQMRVLQYKCKDFQLFILIILEKKRSLMKTVNLSIFPSIMQ